jgi:hypothetical protein
MAKPIEIMQRAADAANDVIKKVPMPTSSAQIVMTEHLLVAGFGLTGRLLLRILRAIEDQGREPRSIGEASESTNKFDDEIPF